MEKLSKLFIRYFLRKDMEFKRLGTTFLQPQIARAPFDVIQFSICGFALISISIDDKVDPRAFTIITP